MKKNKKKSRGFTLIEILATLFIISLVSGIVVVYAVKFINNSENSGKELSYNNVIKSGVDYLNENLSKIFWVGEKTVNEENEVVDGNTEFTCVSVISLINYGYFTADNLKNSAINENSYIKLTRDRVSKTVIKEEMDKEGESAINEQCSQYYIRIPRCSNAIYNAYEQNLVTLPSNFDDYKVYKKDATGNYVEGFTAVDYSPSGYSLKMELQNDEKSWEDGLKDPTRELVCNIKQKKLTIKFDDLLIDEDDFSGNNYIGDKKKYLDFLNGNVRGLALQSHQITTLDLVKNTASDKITPSGVTIKDVDKNQDVTSNYLLDYKNSNLTVYSNRIEVPTSSICNDLTYNGNPQVLATSDNEYTLSSNSGTNAGKYTVSAVPNEGFEWMDRTTTRRTFECEIKKRDASSITLADKSMQYTGNNLNFDKSDVTVKGINNVIINEPQTTYTFDYYTDSRCTNATTNHKNLGTYYGKATVKDISNYKDGTSNCAKLEIVNKITVTYNANGGSVNPNSAIAYTNSTYGNLPTPSRTGYSFTNWYSELTGGTVVTRDTTITSMNSHSIYARWTPNSYNLSYDSRGGSGCSSKTVTYDSPYGNLCSTSRTGYIFDDWYTSSSGGSRVTSSTTVTTARDHTLYARWTARSFTLSYNNNGGSGCSSKTIYYDSTYGSLCTPSRTGYSFDGWYTSSSGGSRVTSSNYVTSLSNQTVYAHWSRDFSCSSVGSSLYYSGSYWTVIKNTSSYCYIALNSISSSSGSYNNAYSNLKSEYVTGRKLSTFANEFYEGLADIEGSNSGTNSGVSSSNPFWTDSGEVYDPSSRIKYSPSSKCVYKQDSDPSSYSVGSCRQNYNASYSSSYVNSGYKSASNSSSNLTITNGSVSNNYNDYYSTKYSKIKLKIIGNADASSALSYHIDSSETSFDRYNQESTSYLDLILCQGSYKKVSFQKLSKTQYTYNGSTYNYSSSKVFGFVGSTSVSNGKTLYDLKNDSDCKYSITISDTYVPIHYRLYASVRTY